MDIILEAYENVYVLQSTVFRCKPQPPPHTCMYIGNPSSSHFLSIITNLHVNTCHMTLTYSDYTIGWICVLLLKMVAAKAALDELHPRLPASPNNHNIYTLGAIHGHNVACLPFGVYGTTSTFPNLRYSLMVGIAGGVPHPSTTDIRLGDTVVGKRTGNHGGVIQYDYGKTLANGIFQRTRCLNKPPAELLSALATLKFKSNHFLGKWDIGYPSDFGSDASGIPSFCVSRVAV